MSTSLPPEISALMGSEVTVHSESDLDAFGKSTYALKGTYKCYPVFEDKLVRTTENREERSTCTLYVDADDLTPQDRYTFNGRIMVCLSVSTHVDQFNQTWGQTVYLQ
jgi:hypothetical protein